MTAQNGRGFIIQMDIAATPTTIGGATTGGLTINNEPIDVTNKDSLGWRTLIADGLRNADVALSGVNLDDATIGQVRTDHLAQNEVDITVIIPGTSGGSAGSYTMTAVIASLEETGEEGGALTYTVSFNSTGAVVFTDLV